jgi:hypothetical protein
MGDKPFTPGRDDPRRVPRPITVNMDSAVGQTPTTDTRTSSLHLLRDCLALGRPANRRRPAKVRLEEALGPELTRKLLESLDTHDRK